LIHNGSKFITGGDKSDRFILKGSVISGKIDGGLGENTVDLLNFISDNNKTVFIHSKGQLTFVYTSNSSILVSKNTTLFVGRPALPDVFTAGCEHKFFNGNGGSANRSDVILIPLSLCL